MGSEGEGSPLSTPPNIRHQRLLFPFLQCPGDADHTSREVLQRGGTGSPVSPPHSPFYRWSVSLYCTSPMRTSHQPHTHGTLGFNVTVPQSPCLSRRDEDIRCHMPLDGAHSTHCHHRTGTQCLLVVTNSSQPGLMTQVCQSPILEKLRQEDCRSKASTGYRVSSRATWETR